MKLNEHQTRIKRDGDRLLDKIIEMGYNVREMVRPCGKKRGIVYFPEAGCTVIFPNFANLLLHAKDYFNLNDKPHGGQGEQQ